MKPILFLLILTSLGATAQSRLPSLVNFTADQDHENMMDQLGIKVLRPGPSGDEKAPNHANYDEALANPFPNVPDPLTLNNGTRVISPDMWWKLRRPEIVEDMDREVYGRVPKNIPSINWKVVVTDKEYINRIPVTAQHIVGHVDNASYPLIQVDIDMMLVLPARSKGPVPLLMMFGSARFPAPAQPNPGALKTINEALRKLLANSDPSVKAVLEQYPAYQPISEAPGSVFFGFGPPPPPKPPTPDLPGVPGINNDPTSIEQLIADGWGFIYIDPNSIQADNGAGLTKGIIGLVNQGQPRKPDDWGALRAWAWGAGEALRYLESNEKGVDSKHIGIEGVSRYGKAALVTLAYEPHLALALVGSSGEGGAKLHRRNWGEAVESLTGGGYYWMAGNFLKYGAEESKFGRKTAADLPVDSHELIALCAPRGVFISYGIPEKGDAKWLDHQGSYMAAIAAGPVFKLLGGKDLGLSNDYKTEKMPPVNTPLLSGDLAWRQHDQGHQDQANMKWFLKWADHKIGHTP